MANKMQAGRLGEDSPGSLYGLLRNVLEVAIQDSKSYSARPLREFPDKESTTSPKCTMRGINAAASGISQPLIIVHPLCCAAVAVSSSQINRVSKSEDSNFLCHIALAVPQYIYFRGRSEIHWV